MDTFNMMMFAFPTTTSYYCRPLFVDLSQAWWLGILTFATQITLSVLVIYAQVDVPEFSDLLSILLGANHVTVTITQGLGIPLAFITQSDEMNPLVTL